MASTIYILYISYLSTTCLYVPLCLYSLFCSLGYFIGTNLSAAVAHSICEVVVETLKTDGDRQVQLLRLPNKENWPFLDSNILFARDFYQSFYDTYLGGYENGTKLIVCGTPGIGKSVFGCYCIYRALMDGKRVVYRTSQLEMWWFVYDRCSVSTHSEMPFALLQDFENVIYIYKYLIIFG